MLWYKGKRLQKRREKMDTTHEIVLPTDPLPVWLYVHHNNPVAFIAPHWHQGIEVSFTLDGSIDELQNNLFLRPIFDV